MARPQEEPNHFNIIRDAFGLKDMNSFTLRRAGLEFEIDIFSSLSYIAITMEGHGKRDKIMITVNDDNTLSMFVDSGPSLECVPDWDTLGRNILNDEDWKKWLDYFLLGKLFYAAGGNTYVPPRGGGSAYELTQFNYYLPVVKAEPVMVYS